MLTSLSSRTVRVRALVQSPQGALPLVHQGRLAFSTTTQLVTLAPFQSSLLEYGFYWPAPGLFRHYPLQIFGASGRLVGCASAGRALMVLPALAAPGQALAAAGPPSLAAPAPASAGSASTPAASSLDATDPALEWQRIRVLASDAEVLAFLRQVRPDAFGRGPLFESHWLRLANVSTDLLWRCAASFDFWAALLALMRE